MRKAISLSLDEKVLEALTKRAQRRHLSLSRATEEILRKTLRVT
jgi:Ribbon-helix-helix protein, copG family.